MTNGPQLTGLHVTAILTATQLATWRSSGRLVLRDALGATHLRALDRAARDVEWWASSNGPGLHHFELTDDGPKIARSEDFEPHHGGLSHFLRSGLPARVPAELFGEPAVLFKEKINYKLPGGAGFAPHQDATAYRQGRLAAIDRHISVMVPLDAATVASGCLYFTTDGRDRILPNTDGRIDPDWVESTTWQPVEVGPGDLVFFDSFTPHYSDQNRSDSPRRAMYLTYNAASAGDHRAWYYDDKRKLLSAAEQNRAGERRARISVNDDFLGRPVD